MKPLSSKSCFLAAVLLAASSAWADFRDPTTVDAIAAKPDSPYVLLLVQAVDSWDGVVADILRRKIETYRAFVRTGQLTLRRPDAQGKKVRVILTHLYPPPVEFVTLLESLRTEAEQDGMQLVWGGTLDLLRLADAP